MSEKLGTAPFSQDINPVTSVGSHLQVQDHEVNIDAITSNPLGLGEVGTTLTESEKWFVLKRLHFDALLSLDELPPSATFIFDKIEQMSPEEAVEILRSAIVEHAGDVNIPEADLDLWRELVEYNGPKDVHLGAKYDHSLDGNSSTAKGEKIVIHENGTEDSLTNPERHEVVDWNLQVRLEAVLVAYWSPYPEVRAVTFPYDDPSIPVETFRVYLIGIIWTGIGAVINQFFTERQPSITLAMSVVQVFLYPSGLLCEWVLPKWSFKIWKWTIDLNPGPYTFKEQMLATIFCGVTGGGTSYVSSNILMQKSEIFYDNKWVDFGYQVLLILSTNFLGVGLAGIMRKFSIYPVKAVWPSILPGIALNKTLLTPSKKEKINGWTISAYKFFFIVFWASFLYFWVPDYLFQALSTFNWMTWIKPTNLNLAVVTGSVGGLGLNPIPTFDWNYFSSLLQPLQVPFYNPVNNIIGMFLGFFCILGVWYSNYKWTGYLPINDNGLYTNTGERYSVTAVVDKDSLFDVEKYNEIGPPSTLRLIWLFMVHSLPSILSTLFTKSV
ncbi:Oligopeptide transporter 2 [Candida viswanathii]|uniref:Oligopeptide transporter 2 n=1 Tax=Candida viswanathii TaxID=5486 RepID=A0A367XX42_9ASCO|nr:Oligopeptide transporter 2 [Candida viswanathii]